MHTILPTLPLGESSAPGASPAPTRPPIALDALPDGDVRAAEALATAMAGWDAAEVAAYRESVLAEVAALGDRPLRGFLAAEVAALTAIAELSG